MTSFGAAPSALGYFYQCELALLEFLRREDPALEISIELLDDIAFEGDQLELVQAKYHVVPGSLTDGSPDLWKTLRIWAEGAATRPSAVLTLVTTGTAPVGSIATLLRADDQRDPDRAHDRLETRARAIASKELAAARDAFLALDRDLRLDMTRRIFILDGAESIPDLDDSFASVLRYAAPRDRRDALVSRLREWWLMRAERHLLDVAKGVDSRISGLEIESRIGEIRDQLTVDNLPIDHENLAAPSDTDVQADQRAFVMQLRLIALSNARIRNAIHDHNRAFAQRSRWLREDLVAVGELSSYERRLQEEWERIWLPASDEPEGLSEEEARARGRDIHITCEGASIEPIRPRVSAAYVMRGSMQMLADELKIGWHPEWVARMQDLLAVKV